MPGFNPFTSESVSAGHPDKMADCISDALLDAALKLDRNVRFACETLMKNNLVVVAGEVSSDDCADIIERIEVERVVRQVIGEIGYTPEAVAGFDNESCNVQIELGGQSENIARGINIRDKDKEQGAGDQGMMFGYAVDETDVYMPAPIIYAHRLMQRQAEVLQTGTLDWLRPDAKSQVTLRYDDQGGHHIDTVVISVQHGDHSFFGGKSDGRVLKSVEEGVREEIIKPVLGDKLTNQTGILINPAGLFVTGGPVGDCGLTGRKIIVDTYGGAAHHGGGAFSGKDPSKVDRSGAYAARYVAKNIVAAGLASECEVQISYAIGESKPVSFALDTFGTGRLPDSQLQKVASECFDLTPAGITSMLKLIDRNKRPVYRKTAAYGHFGRKEEGFSWEVLDKRDSLLAAAERV